MGNGNQWTVNSSTTYVQSGGSANALKFDINGSIYWLNIYTHRFKITQAT